eukprot:4435770-Pyramimonas_sp.AAC.1
MVTGLGYGSNSGIPLGTAHGGVWSAYSAAPTLTYERASSGRTQGSSSPGNLRTQTAPLTSTRSIGRRL